jgi:hypothetical protein
LVSVFLDHFGFRIFRSFWFPYFYFLCFCFFIKIIGKE